MKTIGFIGPGKIGLPICTNLVKAGYRVLGYRRSAMTELEKVGGTPARSPAHIGAEADIVFRDGRPWKVNTDPARFRLRGKRA